MYNKQRFKPGYAITEVLIAMVIISISYVQLSRSLASVMGAAVENISATRAINLAHSTLEEVMAHPFDAVGSEAQGYALEFNGTNEYLDCGDVTVINGASALTISGWMHPNMDSGNDIIFSKVMPLDFEGQFCWTFPLRTHIRTYAHTHIRTYARTHAQS